MPKHLDLTVSTPRRSWRNERGK